jgi:hypothetical protein
VTDACVWHSSDQTIPFLASHRGVFSRVADVVPDDQHERAGTREGTVIHVSTVSLNDLLLRAAAPQRIDYLSIDTEGSELVILEAFDFDRWDVRSISVEHNRGPHRDGLYDVLTAHGYRRKWPELSQFDDWYVRD